jgi:hypothetical protein
VSSTKTNTENAGAVAEEVETDTEKKFGIINRLGPRLISILLIKNLGE